MIKTMKKMWGDKVKPDQSIQSKTMKYLKLT